MSPKVSICIPYHDISQTAFFLSRLFKSISEQSFKDYEIVLTKEGSMPVNTNASIRKAKGELVKILYMDDYFAHPDALKNMVEAIGEDTWLISSCLHARIDEVPHSPHYPEYTEDIHTGVNRLGSPSVLLFRRSNELFFDENLTWLLDCDLYRRFHDQYGLPILLNDLSIVIGLHDSQVSNTLSQEEKLKEYQYLQRKYA